MVRSRRWSLAFAALLAGCTQRPDERAPQPPPPAPVAAPAPAPAAAPAPATPAAAVVPVPAAPPSPAPAAGKATVPSGPMPSLAVNGHAAAGVGKCKPCHKIQHDAWVAGPHPALPLDCEGCHGNGADYRAGTVMKAPAAARAAGLKLPDLAFCKRCHGAGATAALLPKAHAHKAR